MELSNKDKDNIDFCIDSIQNFYQGVEDLQFTIVSILQVVPKHLTSFLYLQDYGTNGLRIFEKKANLEYDDYPVLNSKQWNIYTKYSSTGLQLTKNRIFFILWTLISSKTKAFQFFEKNENKKKVFLKGLIDKCVESIFDPFYLNCYLSDLRVEKEKKD